MKRVVIWWIGALLCGIPTSHSSAATGGVEQLNDAFVKALQAGDIDRITKLYAADAVLFPPGEKAARGLEEIRFKWNALLVANKITQPSFKDVRYVTAANVSAGIVLGLRIFNPAYNVTGVFTTLATSLIAWSNTRRFHELRESYTAVGGELRDLEGLLTDAQTEDDLRQCVAAAEEAVTREHSVWLVRRVPKHPRRPRL